MASSRSYPKQPPSANFTGSSKAGFEKREKRRRIRHLQNLISQCNTAAIKEVLKENFDVDFQYNSKTALQIAVCEDSLEICKLLIARGANVNHADANRNSLLNMACWRGYDDIADLLIDSGADIDSQNEYGNTPLSVSLHRGFPLVAKILLAKGCALNLANKQGHSPLYSVAQAGKLEMVRLLLEGGADPNWGDFAHKTPLMAASEAGRAEAVAALISSGATVNSQSQNGGTALHEAVRNGHIQVLQHLLDADGNPDLATVKGTTPLLDAINNGQVAASQALIKAKCNVNQSDRRQLAPIHAAIAQVCRIFEPSGISAMKTVVGALIDAGADINLGDEENCTPLYQAASAGDLELSKFLLRKGAKTDMMSTQGSSILHAAVFGGNPDVVCLCLAEGCDVNALDKNGRHPLLVSVSTRCDLSIVKQLVEAGSDVNIGDNATRQTALHEAMCQHYVSAARFLIDSGSNMKVENVEGESPLYLACERGLIEIVEYLLKEKNCSPHSSMLPALPIHAASTAGRAATIAMLADAGCDLNQANHEGKTPLSAALHVDNFAAVRALLQCGADLEAQQKVTMRPYIIPWSLSQYMKEYRRKQVAACRTHMGGLLLSCMHQKDQHPHLGLEPLFLAMTHHNMHMMRMLLNCYRQVPRKIIRLLEVLMNQTDELKKHFSAQQKAEILDLLRIGTQSVFPLSDLCRRCIRASLGSPLKSKVEQLPIARKVMSYILMDAEFEEWQELEEEMSGGLANELFVWRNFV